MAGVTPNMRGEALYMPFFFIGIPLIFLILVFWGTQKILSRWITNNLISIAIALCVAVVLTFCIYPFMFPLMEVVDGLVRYGYIR